MGLTDCSVPAAISRMMSSNHNCNLNIFHQKYEFLDLRLQSLSANEVYALGKMFKYGLYVVEHWLNLAGCVTRCGEYVNQTAFYCLWLMVSGPKHPSCAILIY